MRKIFDFQHWKSLPQSSAENLKSLFDSSEPVYGLLKFKELKISFGMERLPCGDFGANAVFFRLAPRLL